MKLILTSVLIVFFHFSLRAHAEVVVSDTVPPEDHPSTGVQSPQEPINPRLSAWIWNINDSAWRELAPLPLPKAADEGLDEFNATIVDGRIYVWGSYRDFGGTSLSDRADNRFTLRSYGGIYDFQKNEWREFPREGSPEGRRGAFYAWMGKRLVIWGGRVQEGGNSRPVSTGAYYEIETDKWSKIADVGAPQVGWARYIALGPELLVWGSVNEDPNQYKAVGGLWDIQKNSWRPMSVENSPDARYMNVAVPFGGKLLVWGAQSAVGCIGSGGWYDPVANEWSILKPTNHPDTCKDYITIWTGTKLFVWSGKIATYDPLSDDTKWVWTNTGSFYDPEDNRWTAIQREAAPKITDDYNPSKGLQALWTGEKLLLYRVGDLPGSCNWDGYFYDSKSDRWGELTRLTHPTTSVPEEMRSKTVDLVWQTNRDKPEESRTLIASIDPQNAALRACRNAPKIDRNIKQFRGDQLLKRDNDYITLSNRANFAVQ